MDEQQSSKKNIWIIFGVIIFLVIGIGVYFFISRGGVNEGGVTGIGSLFGQLGDDTPRPQTNEITPGSGEEGVPSGAGTVAEEPLFRQLANIQVAGATTVTRGGKAYVRYIARENGFVYDVDPTTGATTQLTNTTIPRIYEAYWANSGNSVVVRYLTRDQLSRKDVIKTLLANLALPISSSESTTLDTLGSLESGAGNFLPDNIPALSVSPDGKQLFYLLPVTDGVSGSIVNATTKATREVLRNSFSEWLPQLLNNGTIILTTKASANVPGFSYLYNPTNKTFSRLVREKNGLTTFALPTGGRMLYSENISGNTTLSLYDAKGFTSHEETLHTAPLQLATLPEKCAWSKNQIRLYCGAFSSTPRAEIPDDWYQGVLAFSDTFWTINSDTSEIVFLADPTKDESANKSFDVFLPFVGADENHFFFVDKNDATLWSMRIQKEKFAAGEEEGIVPEEIEQELTPAEMRDAGVSPTTPSATPAATLGK